MIVLPGAGTERQGSWAAADSVYAAMGRVAASRSLWLVDWKVLRGEVDSWDSLGGFDIAHAKQLGQTLRADAVVLVAVQDMPAGLRLAAAVVRPTIESAPDPIAEAEGPELRSAAAALATQLVAHAALRERTWNCRPGGPCRLTTR